MKRRLLLLAAGLAVALAPGMASAQRFDRGGPDSLGRDWGQQQDAAREGVRRGRLVPMGAVISRIAQRYPGRPLDAGMEERAGRVVYRVRWATNDGRRIDFIVDAESGAIIGGG